MRPSPLLKKTMFITFALLTAFAISGCRKKGGGGYFRPVSVRVAPSVQGTLSAH